MTNKTLFCKQVEKLCIECGLVHDVELDKERNSKDLNYGINYNPDDYYNYDSKHPDAILILLRFYLENDTVTIYEDYVEYFGQAIEQKGEKFITYHAGNIDKVRKKLKSILKAYDLFVEHSKIVKANLYD